MRIPVPPVAGRAEEKRVTGPAHLQHQVSITSRLVGWSAHALVFCAVVSFVTPPRGAEPRVDHRSPKYLIEASAYDDGDGDGLMFSEIPVILLTNRSGGAAKGDWMRLETDPCGLLKRVENGRSVIWQSAAPGDGDDPDDDPSFGGRTLIAQWLSDHSELAVINDGIDKGCDGDWSGADDFPPAMAMLGRNDRVDTWRLLDDMRRFA